MSEVKKIATRESYGNALVELGKEHEDLVTLQKLPRRECSKKLSRNVTLTVESLSVI
jgi:transketolase C-terminal domain/subunit